MPLNLAEFNTPYRISKVCGQEKQRHYLESLGFIAGRERGYGKSKADR